MQLFYSVSIQKKNNFPIYKQIGDAFIAFIDQGYLPYGSKLPPIRKMAEQLKVNNDTVVGAYKYMEKKGYVCSQKGSGTYVCHQMERAISFQFQVFKNAMEKVMEQQGEKAFSPEEWRGAIALRGAIVQQLQGQVKVLPENTWLVLGLQAVIEILLRTFTKPYNTIETPLQQDIYQLLYHQHYLQVLQEKENILQPAYKIEINTIKSIPHVLFHNWQEIYWADEKNNWRFQYISFSHLLPENMDFGFLAAEEGCELFFNPNDFPCPYLQKSFEMYVKDNIMRI